MRQIKLSGRETSILRAIGFSEPVIGSELLESSFMEPEDACDVVNSLIAAGFVESVPFREQMTLEHFAETASK